MSLGTFTLLKNEIMWIGPHIASILPFIDQMVFFDGNSTDGTKEIIKDFQQWHPRGCRITLLENKDPQNLQDAYVDLFNKCMKTLVTDFAWFLHPDMYVTNPRKILDVKKSDAIAMSTKMTSYAGDPGGQVLQFKTGRSNRWKNIYRLRNPDLGAHYFGHYGAQNEDIYFSDITGDEHEHFGDNFKKYPYIVEESGIEVMHFSDIRPYGRRLERMKRCMLNQLVPIENTSYYQHWKNFVDMKRIIDKKDIPSQFPYKNGASLNKLSDDPILADIQRRTREDLIHRTNT
jgi:glycosyltransferase involved in cell wall biosynthesis